MSNIRTYVIKRKMLIKMISTYSIISLIVLAVFSFIIVDRVSMNLTEDVNASAERITKQSYNTADNLLSSSYNYFASTFIRSQEINFAMFGSEFTNRELFGISTQLNELKQANSLIYSIYIYNANNDLIFSGDSPVTNAETFFDGDMIALLKRKDLYKEGIFIPRHLQEKKDDQMIDKKLITIIYTDNAKDGRMDGALILNLDQELLQEMVTKGSGDSSLQSFIVNSNGKIISHTDSGLFNKDVSKDKFIERIVNAKENSGHFNTSINSTSSFVSYVRSERLGWTFVSTAENENLLIKVNGLKRFIVLITVIFVGAALTLGILSSRLMYRPISELVKRLGASSGDKSVQPMNEFDSMLHSFQNMESRVNDLQKDISGFMPAKKKEVLSSIIKNGLPCHPSDKVLQELNIDLYADRYKICVLRIDDYENQFQRYDLSDIALFKYAISNISEEVLTPHYGLEIWDDNEDAVILLIHWKEHAESEQTPIYNLMKEIQGNILNYLKMSVTIAIGPNVPDMERIPLSWEQAYRASRYRLTHGPGSIIPYNDERQSELKQHDYPLMLEKQITDSLRSGERPRLQQLAEEFFKEIATYQYDEIMLYIYQLSVMTVRAASDMVSEEELLKSGMLSLPETIRKRGTIGDMQAEFTERSLQIIELRNSRSSLGNIKLVKLIEENILQGYVNPNLSVDHLAEGAGLSTNYARKLFKDQTGKTISQYITDIRFEQAQRLLLETDYPAGKVGEMVGITNTNYFYASFKKHTGMSPVHFRKEHRLNP